MKIGIDGRFLSYQRGGIYRYATSVFRELQRLDENNDYYVYGKSEFDLPIQNARWHKRVPVDEHPRLGIQLDQFALRKMISQDSPDLFWGTAHFFPVGVPPSAATILTVHDLVWHRYPRTMGFKAYLTHRLFADRSIRRADKILAVSQSTANDIRRTLAVDQDRIVVTNPAPEAHYSPGDQKEAANFIARKYGTRADYICTVGAFEPRKNLRTLIEALYILRGGDFPYQLVAAGYPGWGNVGIHEALRKFGLSENDIKLLGYVPEEDMPALYSGARLFVFPSLYEGFGIPLVEAMACGVPVVASDASSIPEVVGDAAVLVSPRRPDDFATAIKKVASDSELRTSMIQKGLRRSKDFSWERTGRKILQVMLGFQPSGGSPNPQGSGEEMPIAAPGPHAGNVSSKGGL
jgi:glycosyltransferase involved in cell wall biosynthesis